MDIYLIKVDSIANNNKFYRMHHDDGSNFFDVTYGRVGTQGVVKTYPFRMWNKIYKEKINKGYSDQSALRSGTSEYGVSFVGSGSELLEELVAFSKKAIKRNYTIMPGQVSKRMIKEAQSRISYLQRCEDVESFNTNLNELFKIIPRSMNIVSNFLAKDKNSFGQILKREQDLLDVMESMVDYSSVSEENTIDVSSLNLDIQAATEDEMKEIRSKLDDRFTAKIKRAYRVINTKTQEEYNEFIKKYGINKTKLLWHGSGNENWFSILQKGLLIRPSCATYTGSMFGDGIYFAPRASKSFGYTNGGYWKGGDHSDVRIMGLYDVATGDPYYPNQSEYSLSWNKIREKGKYHSTYAKAEKTGLRNDEIICYRTDQVTIKYLVEFY